MKHMRKDCTVAGGYDGYAKYKRLPKMCNRKHRRKKSQM